jgi:DNA-binding CsgD family transcriptional regulator
MVWYEKFGWKDNPFTIDPIPDALVIDDVKDRLREYIESEMIVNLYGDTGSGKSTILNWFSQNLEGKFHPVYIDFSTIRDYAPENTDEKNKQYYGFLNKIETESFKSFFEPLTKLFLKAPLIKRLESKYKEATLVLLLDEANEVKDERISSYIRSLNDNVKCATLIASVKPLSEIEIFKESLRIARVSEYIKLRKLTAPEAKLMLKERIENAGGEGTKPFDDKAVNRIITLSSNSPREILEIASSTLMHIAMDRKVTKDLRVTEDVIDSVYSRKGPKSEKREPIISKLIKLKEEEPEEKEEEIVPAAPESVQIDLLSDKQRKIVLALKNGAKTSEDLAAELNITNNALFTDLYRLMLKRDHERMRKKGVTKPVILKSSDTPHKYSLSAEWKLGMVEE